MTKNSAIMKLQGQEEKLKGIYYEVNPDEIPLGEGGTGIVRHGVMVDEKSGIRKDVAIKFLYSDLSDSAIQRSQREAEIHIVHENLVEMLGFVQIGAQSLYGKGCMRYHVVSELLNGVMLLDMLQGNVSDTVYDKMPKVKALKEQLLNNRYLFALSIAKSVLSGIQALHDNGYIHRDIDPSNIMITQDGKIKLIDLGICKKLSNLQTTGKNLTSNGQFVGKAAYAAPELVRGDLAHQNATTDIYAIGIMLYQIITGSLPFQGTIQDILDKQVNSKLPLQNIHNDKIRDLIKTATEKKQSNRFKSAAEFRVAIDRILNKGIEVEKNVSVWGIAAVISVVGIAIGISLGLIF